MKNALFSGALLTLCCCGVATKPPQATQAQTTSSKTSHVAAGEPAPLYVGQTPLADQFAFRGRFDLTDPAQPQFDWENAGVGVHFRGSDTLIAHLNNVQNIDPENWIVVNVDGVDTNKIAFAPGITDYVLAQGLGTAEHTVWINKAQEFGFGPVAFGGFVLDDNAEILSVPTPAARRMEFIGSSTLSGWGADSVLDPSLDCNDLVNYPTTNAMHSIPRYTADLLSADYTNISRGGRGILCSFAPGAGTLPQSYGFITDTDQKSWDFSQWPADVVVIEAGGSDFNLGDEPVGTLEGYPDTVATQPETFSIEQFYDAYVAFVNDIRGKYPNVTVVLVNTKDFTGSSADLFKSTLDRVAANFSDGKVLRFDYFATPVGVPSPYTSYDDLVSHLGEACDAHPTPEASQILAQRLALFVGQNLGWSINPPTVQP